MRTDRRAVMTRLVVAICSVSVPISVWVSYTSECVVQGRAIELQYEAPIGPPLLLRAAMDSWTRDLERVLFSLLFTRLRAKGNISEHCVITILCWHLSAQQIELQGDQKVCVHPMITIQFVRCTEIFWSHCTIQCNSGVLHIGRGDYY